MKEISRRTVLVGATVSTIALGVPVPTADAEPAREAPPVASACGDLGSTQVCVTAREVQDVTGLQYVITNRGARPMTYTVWYVDVTGGPESGRVTETVGAGETVVGYFYGAIQHCFTLHMCHEAESECVVLGPVCGEYPSSW
ncbi:hypothetical protein ACFC18_55345 [Streptomyces sp. NPDC056121]|uniref:hypothetical protein n=1 Tax=Streptomyces TaxID=1883 RepID=UPI001D0AC43D|nr:MULTISPECIES: hypothetical protein [Streptomyces]MCX5085310.1 hypothetical protein [Streptomyces sp. NBC_00401]UDM03427.1 hypothetical protein LGI35_36890 [Streptomyces longhuiensis]